MANIILSKIRGLIPTARVDKNGRVVIRHMRPDEMGAGELRTPIPPIQQKPAANPQLMRKAMENVLEAAGFDEYDWGQAVEMMSEQIENFLPSTLERMISLKNGEDGGASFSIYNEFYAPKADETFINDLAQLGPHIGERDIAPIGWILASEASRTTMISVLWGLMGRTTKRGTVNAQLSSMLLTRSAN